MKTNPVTIDFKRFKQTLDSSSDIGKVRDTGLYRLALSDEDKKMRDLFKKWMEADGLNVRIDDAGNMYGRREGEQDLPPVLIGSHLDTQPFGGRYDGIAGVLLSLEVIRTLNDNDIKTKRPIEIVNFTNEEGARFEPPMMASGLLVQQFSQDFVYSRTDIDGLRFVDQLERIGYKGSPENRIKDIHSFVEVHIEQGSKLEQTGSDIGIVEGIQGMNWFEITINGHSNHAGSTSMHLRKDALMTGAEMIHRFEQKAADHSLLLTIGKFETSPGSVNVIPEQVKFSLDIRSDNDTVRNTFINEVKAEMREISHRREVQIDIQETWTSPTVNFDPALLDIIDYNSKQLGLKSLNLMSGAGHDARYISEIAPTAMIFTPSMDGISHDISEYTTDDDIYNCGNLYLEVVCELANRDKLTE